MMPSHGKTQPTIGRLLAHRPVVTCFLLHRAPEGDHILLLRRSDRVSTYQGRWAAVSGSIEETPERQALIEIREETGLNGDQVRLCRQGRPFVLDAPELERCWVIHPFLFQVDDPSLIRLNWEHTEGRWLSPAEIGSLPTVPALAEALARVYPTDGAGTQVP